MADMRKECARFEELSEHIVQHIFKDTNAVVRKTQGTKDGGYDIVVESKNGQKVYFECKLRNKNLNLRDIAANIIIAYNEGAIAMVALTNHNYTLQTDEHISHFLKKTILNIKIIIGEDINKLVKRYNIPISSNLSELIKESRTYRNPDNSLLQIDFSKDNVHEQIIVPFPDVNGVTNSFGQVCEKLASALTVLRKGGILAISGLLGVGKRKFIESAATLKGGISIWIDASLHQTKERALVDILLSVWGITATNIFEEFTDNHVDSIIERLNERISNPKTLNILRRLFGDTRILGINDEDYNLLICDYIVDILEMHKETFPYIFIFDSLAYAKEEIFILFSYMIKKLSRKKIPCAIIQDSEEYAAQRSIDLQTVFGYLPFFVPMTISAYTKDEAINHIRDACPEIPLFLANEIINQVGTRSINISMFLEYIRNIGISVSDYKSVAMELQTLQPNSVPTIMSKVLSFYRLKDNSKLFDLLFLLRGKISEQLCNKLAIDADLLEQLLRGGVLTFSQGYYVCANRIANAIIYNWGNIDSPRVRCIAKDILKIWETESSIGTAYERANLLICVGKHEQALIELLPYINHLECERQYDALIIVCDTIIDLHRQLNDPFAQIETRIYQLRIMGIKKALLTPKAKSRLKELTNMLEKYMYLNLPYHFVMASDYFKFMIKFKNGNYDTTTNHVQKMQQYFNSAVDGSNIDNTDDWLGSICNRYVLCIKENEGYDAALSAYIRVCEALPNSNRLWRGHISHLACMSLYDAPENAFEYYEKLINSSHKANGLYSLPFHEYVDRAMSKLLSGDNTKAVALAQYAIDICEANAIYDEWGRGLNILGCALVCQGKLAEAKALFKESLEMLKISGYKLFSWRSQLNFIHMSLEDGCDYKLLSDELEEAYQCFISLHGAKTALLLEKGVEKIEHSRDYHALLAFALYRSKVCGQIDYSVTGDFDFGSYLNRYKNDLNTLFANPTLALPNSNYYREQMIMMVG